MIKYLSMKKTNLFAFLSIITLSLTSCDVNVGDEEQLDPNEIIQLKVKGSLKKTHYALDDEWDFSGLSVYTVTRGKKETKLNEDEYTMSYKVPTPKDFVSNLMITYRYKANTKIFTSYTASGISVDSPTYDEDAEKTAYYADLNIGTKTKEDLRAELQRHSFSKHQYYVTYGNVALYKSRMLDKDSGEYIESTDLIPNKSKLQGLYTGKEAPYGFGTKEHVWACADSSGLWVHNGYGSHNVDNNNYIGGGSDLYHIRPVDSNVNTARGDAPFIDFDDSEFSIESRSTVSIGDGGPYKLKIYGADKEGSQYKYATYVEVADEMKGDIARIIAYVYMHYCTVTGFTPSTSETREMVGDLDITRAIGYNMESKAFRKLVEWNNLDPVSNVEKYRNHTVMGIQGNRNPFVDYPDLMQKVFG